MQDSKIGCAAPVKPVTEEVAPVVSQAPVKEVKPMVRVGYPAPDFTAPAFHDGQFTEVTMSDYLAQGKWVYICFYPGDFTFV